MSVMDDFYSTIINKTDFAEKSSNVQLQPSLHLNSSVVYDEWQYNEEVLYIPWILRIYLFKPTNPKGPKDELV